MHTHPDTLTPSHVLTHTTLTHSNTHILTDTHTHTHTYDRTHLHTLTLEYSYTHKHPFSNPSLFLHPALPQTALQIIF